MKKRTTGARRTSRQKIFEEEPVPFRCRLEPRLYDRLRARATKNRNSLSLELHLLLEKVLER